MGASGLRGARLRKQDLATYRIAQLTPHLELEERHAGDGALCGSAMLNLRFMELMKLKLGDHISKEELNDVS